MQKAHFLFMIIAFKRKPPYNNICRIFWDYWIMDNKKKLVLTLLALAGLLISLVLCWVYINANFLPYGLASFCSVNGTIDCDGVAKTSFSQFLGIPLALWGVFLYVVILFLLGIESFKKIHKKVERFLWVFKNPQSYIAVLGIISFTISLLLATISIFAIQKICYLCFITYFIDLAIAFVAKSKGSFFIEDFKVTIKDFVAGAKEYTALTIVAIIAAAAILLYTSVALPLAPQLARERSMKEFLTMKENPWKVEGNTLGAQVPEVTVKEFSDFKCPYCRTMNYMLHKLVRDNKTVRVFYINYPLDKTCNPYVQNTMHEGACMLARYTLAAREQGRYWDLADKVFDKQPNTEADVLDLAKELDFDTARLKRDANSARIARYLKTHIEIAHSQGITGTPTISIGEGSNVVMQEGLIPYPQLKAKVEEMTKLEKLNKKELKRRVKEKEKVIRNKRFLFF